jgi:lysine/ornithine N-monooxygenase
VKTVEPTADGRQVNTVVTTPDGYELGIEADFIIDATGLEASIEEHRVLKDLLSYGGADKNPKGRLNVDHDFLVRGTESGAGRLYASGSITLGGYYAGVDSFLGLQYASLRIADAMAAEGFCKKIGPLRSAAQWTRWARNKTP